MIYVDLLPDEVKQELACHSCSNFLSVRGVTVNEYGDYTCGRCLAYTEHSIPASAYEALASLMKFPCTNVTYGCKKQLSWGSVLDHEKACNYRVFKCVAANCDWESNVTDLNPHITSNHSNIILKKNFFKLPSNTTDTKNVITAYDAIFLVEYKFSEEQILHMDLKYLGKPSESGRFTYDVVIQHGPSKKIRSVKVYNGKVRAFRDYGNPRQFMDVEVDMKSLDNVTKSSNIKCFINIIEKVSKKIKKQKSTLEIKSSDLNSANISEKECINSEMKSNTILKKENTTVAHQKPQNNIFRELECPVCNEYMVSPIFVCVLGHSICSACKLKLSKCPTCSSAYGDTRNYTLESMLQLINFPCQNELHGCKFTGSASKIQKHKNNCKFENIKCPVLQNCDWKGTIELLHNHLEKHRDQDIFLNLNEIITYNFNLQETCHNLVRFDNSVLRISCKHSKEAKGLMRWSFQKIFPKQCSKFYKIEIEFIDQTDNGRKFIINDIFKDESDTKNIFNENLAIPLTLLKPYTDSSQLLHFKYHIY